MQRPFVTVHNPVKTGRRTVSQAGPGQVPVPRATVAVPLEPVDAGAIDAHHPAPGDRFETAVPHMVVDGEIRAAGERCQIRPDRLDVTRQHPGGNGDPRRWRSGNRGHCHCQDARHRDESHACQRVTPSFHAGARHYRAPGPGDPLNVMAVRDFFSIGCHLVL